MAYRNLAIDGGSDICGEMYNKRVMEPLKGFLPKVFLSSPRTVERPSFSSLDLLGPIYLRIFSHSSQQQPIPYLPTRRKHCDAFLVLIVRLVPFPRLLDASLTYAVWFIYICYGSIILSCLRFPQRNIE